MARFSDLINGTPANGYVPLNKAGDSLSSTNGSGFLGYPPQSSAPSTPASGFRLYANASGLLEWKGTNGFTRTFDGTANTANRAYTLPNSSGTIALEGTLTSLANPTIQNGVYQFAQNTKPTQRATGVPLVAGDRWFKTDDQTEWSWNGTYWVSPQKTVGWVHGGSLAIRYTASSTSDVTYSVGCLGKNVFVHSVLIQVVVNSINNGSNYWTVGAAWGTLRISDSVFISSTPILFDTTSLLPTTPDVVTVAVNTLAGASLVDIRRGQILKVGSPGELYLNYAIKYSEVA